MRICVTTGATYASDSCTKAIGRRRTTSHLVSPSRLQVARQSYILQVSHIHLCDWRSSLLHVVMQSRAASQIINKQRRLGLLKENKIDADSMHMSRRKLILSAGRECYIALSCGHL